jgi:hypothetical protein
MSGYQKQLVCPPSSACVLLLMQDLGEPLAALLPYPEREQLVAVSLDGTAWVLSRPADASRAAASRSSVGGAFMWSCALRMVLAKASEDNPLAVSRAQGWQAVQGAKAWATGAVTAMITGCCDVEACSAVS